VRLSALLQANSMTPATVIHPGQVIVIPAGAVPPPTRVAGPSPAGSTRPVTTPPAVPTAGRYVVRAGDTLSGIARRHGVGLGALLTANSMTPTSLLLPGRTLVVPPSVTPAASPAPPAVVAPPPSTIPALPGTVAGTPRATAPSAAAAPATAPAGSSMRTVLDFLRLQVGLPYRFFAAGPDAFDCSGLVVAAFRQVGVALPHQSRAQAQQGTAVDWRTSPIMPGDLVFTSAINDPRFISHVGVALSSTTWVHAVGHGRTVSIGSLPASSRIMAVQRIALP
jgi:cell wall-associated NlpC family hydrolase